MDQPKFDNSIAVLPFVNLGENREDDYLGNGIANEVINGLARITDLKVTARTSSFSFKEGVADIPTIGKKLGVASILEGTVARFGDRIRVNVQLVNVEDGFQLWSEKYDRSFTAIFDLQDELAQRICEQLKIKLSAVSTPERPGYSNVEAYNLYLKGLFFSQRWSADNVEKAMAFFSKSIELDPLFALPYSGVANCWSLRAVTGNFDVTEAYRQMRTFTLKALELDDRLAESHLSMALLKLFRDADLSGSFYSFQTAMNLNPGLAEVHHIYSFYLNCLGKNREAIREVELAAELDPLSSQVNSSLAYSLMVAGEYERAITQFEKTLELDPGSETAREGIGWTYLFQKKYDEAEEILNVESHLLTAPVNLCYLNGVKGNKPEAEKYLDQLLTLYQKDNYLNRELSMAYTGLGDFERACHYAEKAFEQKIGFATVLSHPAWKPLREHPRFYKLRKKLGLNHARLIENHNLLAREQSVIKSETREELVLNLKDLLFIEAQANYSRIVWLEQEKIREKLLRISLSGIEEQALSPNLYRCHKSFIINTKARFHVHESSRNFRLTPVNTNLRIPVSRTRIKELSAKLSA